MNESLLFEKLDAHYDVRPDACPHRSVDVVVEDGVMCCLECGEQTQRTITHEKEWSFH